jgi:hypothetical protein
LDLIEAALDRITAILAETAQRQSRNEFEIGGAGRPSD